MTDRLRIGIDLPIQFPNPRCIRHPFFYPQTTASKLAQFGTQLPSPQMADVHSLAWKTATTSFEVAKERLEAALSKETRNPLKEVILPSVVRTNVEFTANELEKGFEKLIRVRPKETQERSRVVKEILLKFFRLSHPCLKVFLTIGMSGSSVSCLCLASLILVHPSP
jgi:hypothetical protein